MSESLKRRIAIIAAILAMAFLTAPAAAQPVALDQLGRQLDQTETDLRTVDRALDARVDSTARKALRAKAVAAQGSATGVAGQFQDQLTLIDARIAGLGPIQPGVAEAADVTALRNRLGRQRSALDSAIKRGRLISIEAQQLVDEIDQSQAEELGQQITTRDAAPVSPAFWGAVISAAPRDLRRVYAFAAEGADQFRKGWRSGHPWTLLAGLILAAILSGPARSLGRRVGQHLLVEGAPGHRLRRSANALWRIVVGTAAPTLAAVALVQGAHWSDLVPERWSDLLDTFVVAVGISALIASIGGAVLMRSQPSWRLAPLSDETAKRLRPSTLLLAALALSTRMLDGFNTTVGASHAAVTAAHSLGALLHILLIGGTLVVIGKLRARRTAEGEEAGAAATASVAMGTLVAWMLVGVASVALLTGYVSFSLFLSRMVAWAAVVSSTFYLLLVATDDVAMSLFTRNSRVGATLSRALGLRGSAIEQFGVLLSGVLRVALVMLAIGLLLSPFGTDIGSIFGRLGVLAQGVDIGGVSVSPGTIVTGVAVLLVGLALVRLFTRWIDTKYLPTTDLDGSGRNSVSLVARYLGIVLAVLWALSSLGIGMEKIALLVSALSVGIGFGLQAITQNFVSGLILLAERPIKIGDLIRVGTDEGDVRRISVRSTEIELPDHSTLIVPNSELITKTVLNKTLSSPLGRIQLQFSVPIATDAEGVRNAVLEAFAAEPAILAEPEPKAFIDSIADGRILFNCFAHVGSPRAAYSARSNVLVALLGRFRADGINIDTVAQRLELVAPAGALGEGGQTE
jgi:small-conductance mechanosensitive channel